MGKKRIIMSTLKEQEELTRGQFLAMSPLERLAQLKKDIERVYAKELSEPRIRTSPRRIIFDENPD